KHQWRTLCSLQNLMFISSRRRHTRAKRDWSSDVCSSDLESAAGELVELHCNAAEPTDAYVFKTVADPFVGKMSYLRVVSGKVTRSEERRVGKEGSYGWWACRCAERGRSGAREIA